MILAIFDAVQVQKQINGEVTLPKPMLLNPATIGIKREDGNEGYANWLTNWVNRQRALGLAQGSSAHPSKRRASTCPSFPPISVSERSRVPGTPRGPGTSNAGLRGTAMFDWTILVANQHLLWWGLVTTLKYTVVTSLIGLLIGLLVALAQLSRFRAPRYFGRVFVEFFRNIPLLVWLLWSY
jgi:hypothetical protein